MDENLEQKVKEIIRKFPKGQDSLIEVLHKIQAEFDYIPPEAQVIVAKELRIPQSKVYGVVTFYHFFRQEPIGKHLITVCKGTACHVRGAGRVANALEKMLGIKVGQTTKDRKFTLSVARCFGACGLAPVVDIDGKSYGRMTPTKIKELLEKFE